MSTPFEYDRVGAAAQAGSNFTYAGSKCTRREGRLRCRHCQMPPRSCACALPEQ